MSLIIQNLAAMQSKVIPGIDSFLQVNEEVKNHRYALVTNNAAFTSAGVMSRMALLRNGFNLKKIFSPEHGISVKGADGVYQDHLKDNITGLPVISLYGDRLIPSEEDLHDIDIVLFDIPDVGCRFYTYLWTMTYVMEACAIYNKRFIVLDRPNPIGGNISQAEGPMLDEENCSSFIGRWSIPIKHCCTLGELALYFADNKIKILDINIVPVKNWNRNLITTDFTPTSPAIQTISTALVYPGMGLLEGINVNEGRGTERPFLQFGAPWINAADLLNEMKKNQNPGIIFSVIKYTPTESIYAGEMCHGLKLDVLNPEGIMPVKMGIQIISSVFHLYPDQVRERFYKTNVNPSGSSHLDKLIGIKNSFEQFRSGSFHLNDISSSWLTAISPYLLYS